MPSFPRPAENMVFQPPPFVAGGFMPNNGMGFMPPYGMPQQKYQPGVFPYPQANFPPQFPSYIDTNQPSFNMNYQQHNNPNNPNNTNVRQGSGKFNKK